MLRHAMTLCYCQIRRHDCFFETKPTRLCHIILLFNEKRINKTYCIIYYTYYSYIDYIGLHFCKGNENVFIVPTPMGYGKNWEGKTYRFFMFPIYNIYNKFRYVKRFYSLDGWCPEIEV